MKKKLLKISYITCFFLAIVLFLAFLVICIMGYHAYIELPSKYPNVAIMPYPSWVKHYAEIFLLPALVLTALGAILKEIYKGRIIKMKIMKIIMSVVAIILCILGMLRIVSYDITIPVALFLLATLIIIKGIEYKKEKNNLSFWIYILSAIFIYIILIYNFL